MPGGRLKLAPQDLVRIGHAPRRDRRALVRLDHARRQRGRAPRRGAQLRRGHDGERFTLKDAIDAHGAEMIGEAMWAKYQKWPVYSKFFDNLGPIPHHMHQNAEQAAKLGREGKPESYYFPPQLNWTGNHFPYTFMGLEPGTTQGRRPPLPRTLERGRQRDHRPVEGLPAQARHRLADSALRPPCPRLARHL